MEKEFIRGTGPGQRYQVFFRIWVLREAIIKATGNGIRMMSTSDVISILEVSCPYGLPTLCYHGST
jgi:phosphopantetheinyl transferase